MVRQNEDLVAIDAELVGWGNGVQRGIGEAYSSFGWPA